jgi:hypothetical protein
MFRTYLERAQGVSKAVNASVISALGTQEADFGAVALQWRIGSRARLITTLTVRLLGIFKFLPRSSDGVELVSACIAAPRPGVGARTLRPGAHLAGRPSGRSLSFWPAAVCAPWRVVRNWPAAASM